MSKLDEWLTKPVVAQALGKSEKTVERLERDGLLRKAYRPVPGRKPIPVYHPFNVYKLKREAEAAAALAETATAVANSNALDRADRAEGGVRAATQALVSVLDNRLPPAGGSDLVGQGVASTAEAMHRLVSVVEMMGELLRQTAQANEVLRELRALPAPAPVPPKLTVDYTEAAELSGLTVACLRKLAREGQLRAFGRGRDARIPRADLEYLLGVRPAAPVEPEPDPE